MQEAQIKAEMGLTKADPSKFLKGLINHREAINPKLRVDPN